MKNHKLLVNILVMKSNQTLRIQNAYISSIPCPTLDNAPFEEIIKNHCIRGKR